MVMIAPGVQAVPPGLSVIVRLSWEMDMVSTTSTGVLPLNTASELVVMVDALTDFENVRTICVFNPTLVVPLDGVMVTVGGVWSTVLAVVNVPNLGYTVLPASSVNPFTNMPIVALAGYWVSGVKVTVAPLTL